MRSCPTCGKPPKRPETRYCSRRCWDLSRRSERVYPLANGYRVVSLWEDGKNRRVLEHRLVMERLLGRRLDPSEPVHHVNGNRADNRPENLRLHASQAEHIHHEHPGRPRETHHYWRHDIDDAEVARRHAAGESLRSISREIGCSIATLSTRHRAYLTGSASS